ncbi:MAG: discoidin domain-containing protein [Planctomycetaceae bacterium]
MALRRKDALLRGGEALESRRVLAVQASLVSGELRISFTPTSTVPEQIARLSSDGTNYTVRNTNNVSIGTFSVATTTAISVTGSTGVDRLEMPATGSQPIADPLTVASTIETTVIAKPLAPGAGGVEIGSPSITLAANVTTPGSQTYAGNVNLGAAVVARTTAAGSRVRFEGVVGGVAGTSLEIDSPGASSLLGGLGGAARLVKRGAGSLEVTNAGQFAAGATVDAGEVVVRQATGLGSGMLSVGSGGRLRLDAGAAQSGVPGLALAAGGRLDLGAGGLRIAAGGYDITTVRQWLVTGRNGGTWDGSAGIVSSAAAGTSGRAIGYATNDDGSLSVAFAAAGDTNLDGFVDVLDATNIIASGAFDTGTPAAWTAGDVTADGLVDVLDVAELIGTGLYDRGGYLPAVVTSTGFGETWERAATSRLPSSDWVLQTGSWGTVAQQDARGAGRKYATAANQPSRLMRPVDLSGRDHVVVQGWFSDSAGTNRGMLGLASFPTVADAALVRMGAAAKSTYRIEYVNPAQPGAMAEIDTGLAAEAGWHFMRLDLVRDSAAPTTWQATFRGWNAARTAEVKTTFSLAFDPTLVRWATLGTAVASTGATAWDDVRVGPLADVGPPPALPAVSPVTATASSSLVGWEPGRAIDGSSGTVFSSTSRGATAVATEWLAVDYGMGITMKGVTLVPRPGGGCFPVDYEIQTSTDMTTWTTVPGGSFTGQTAPATSVTHAFAAAVQARGIRILATRLSPDGSGNHYLQLADVEVPGYAAVDYQAWVTPAELRDKKSVGAGIFSAVNLERPDAPTPAWLASHPEYLANHPFDGITIPIPIDPAWTVSQGVTANPVYGFHNIGLTKLPIPWSVVAPAVADLKRVQWGDVTDNFMWYGVSDMTRDDDNIAYTIDPASAADWSVAVQNAAVAARLCREAGLKGFMMDTEQYTRYASGEEYPFGLGTAATWRERGRQWIEAVQAEYPDITITMFFSWGPETQAAGWQHYQNLSYFSDGILTGIQSPARLVHGWESTFWYGQDREADGQVVTYAGDRNPYAQTRSDIRNVWRTYAADPAKYDDFIEVGMAAWVESDPYNLVDGWPSGFLRPTGPWSNLQTTLAYSDEYVWTWSERTSYPTTSNVLNPFLASIANRTFNLGTEAVASFTDDFSSDPLTSGWYFDFDMLSIGRKSDPDQVTPIMTTDAVAYGWNAGAGGVDVRADWSRGFFGEHEGLLAPHRRRYVKPVEPLTRGDDIRLEVDLTISSFGSDAANPILTGLFHSAATTARQSLAVEVVDASTARVVVAGDGTPWSLTLPLAAPLETGRAYRAAIAYTATTRQLAVELRRVSDGAIVAQATDAVPATAGPFVFDEAGIAQREAAFATPAAAAHRFRLERFALSRG